MADKPIEQGVTKEEILKRILAFVENEIVYDKTFSSGKRGHGAYGKLRIGNRRFQLSLNATALKD